MNSQKAEKDIPFACFKRQLESRLQQLQLAIADRLATRRDDTQTNCGIEMHERTEESLAENLSAAELERELQELRNVRAALRRLKLGTYGMCLDCGQPIVRERLTAQLTAQRCLSCQHAHDERRSTALR